MDFATLSETRPFDGIICIGGEDWWYHNRGHFDFQIMRRIAKLCPVLFINSLGVRLPNPARDREFSKRIGRKLKSLSRGLVEAEKNFFVFSPAAVPGKTGQLLSAWALAPQIRLAAYRIGIERPLLWVHCPAGAELIDTIPSVGIVMQRTDRFEAFPDGDPDLLARQVAHIRGAADLVIYCAPGLLAEERDFSRRQALITHGVELDRFVEAGRSNVEPADVAALPKPRVGFVGGIDHHTFDPELFNSLAGLLPHHTFVLVGGCSLPLGWCPHPNVKLLGRKPYDQVAEYMAAMDVLIMPWNTSPWIAACNPIKLKEYLAVGRPVVTRDFPALDGWRDLVEVANTPRAFADAIERAKPADPSVIRARLAPETWDDKAAEVFELLTSVARGTEGRSRSTQSRLPANARHA